MLFWRLKIVQFNFQCSILNFLRKNPYFCNMKIANVEFSDYPLFLAPMEDVTDPAFRLLCKKFGVDMVYTEFISADALIRNVKRTEQKLTISDEERPVAMQIYGKEVDAMVEAAKIAAEVRPDFIDLNFGCPVRKVAGKGAGAGLLRDIPRMLDITRSVVNAVDVPVTAKTRLGWDDSSKIIVELAEQLQDCGIAALTIHGRTRAQMFKPSADWTLIGEVKNNPRMHIPIIGNGDVATPDDAKRNFDRYGVDAVMVGRACIGKPWVFAEMKHFLLHGEYMTPLSFDEQKAIVKQMILESIAWLGDERKGILHSRRHLAVTPVFKGISHFKETRVAMLRASTLEELFGIIDTIAPSNSPGGGEFGECKDTKTNK